MKFWHYVLGDHEEITKRSSNLFKLNVKKSTIYLFIQLMIWIVIFFTLYLLFKV